MSGDKNIDKKDEDFIKPFMKDGKINVPIETMMFPHDLLKEKLELLEQNKTLCFKIDPGIAGWCATCKVNEYS